MVEGYILCYIDQFTIMSPITFMYREGSHEIALVYDILGTDHHLLNSKFHGWVKVKHDQYKKDKLPKLNMR